MNSENTKQKATSTLNTINTKLKNLIYTNEDTISFVFLFGVLTAIDLYTGGGVRDYIINMSTTGRTALFAIVMGYIVVYIALANAIIDKLRSKGRGKLLLSLSNSDKNIDFLELGTYTFNNAQITYRNDLAEFNIKGTNETVYIARDYETEPLRIKPNWRKTATPSEKERAIINIDLSKRILEQEINTAREINRKIPAFIEAVRQEALNRATKKQDYINREAQDKSLDQLLSENLDTYDPTQGEDIETALDDDYSDIKQKTIRKEEDDEETGEE